ncbi:MAG: NUDIX domain-containing protein [Oscillospiraceae bacterium]|jgi:8-oxo-dGTP diphosphatase|nr:NUDIX domain-containing protein [Oscillospiraceae bacterium]
MRRVNVSVVLNHAGDRVLMCLRAKDPFAGMYNFVGGKAEPGEDGMAAACRELFEETGLTRADIALRHVMDLRYYENDILLEVYAGRLRRDMDVSGDENELLWMPVDEDFFDVERFAGNGNVGHIMRVVVRQSPSIYNDITSEGSAPRAVRHSG